MAETIGETCGIAIPYCTEMIYYYRVKPIDRCGFIYLSAATCLYGVLPAVNLI